jgi:hypothetical protein
MVEEQPGVNKCNNNLIVVEKAKRILIKILINLNIINKNIKGFN